VRVTDVDLSGGRGMRRRHDVICATCLELGHGKQWAGNEAKGVVLSPAPAVPAAPAAVEVEEPAKPAAPVVPAPSPNPVIDAARDRASTLPDEEPGSLAAAASSFSALAPDVPAPAPVQEPVEEASSDQPVAGPSATAEPMSEPAAPAADQVGAKRSSNRASRSTSNKIPSSGAAGSKPATGSTTRAARQAAIQRQKKILFILLGLIVVMLGGLGWMVLGGGKRAHVDPKVIELSAERDKLFQAVQATRDLAFREAHAQTDAEIQLTIDKIHELQDKVSAFEELAKKGGWSEDHVGSLLQQWNISDLYGKLKMWNDERVKRAMREPASGGPAQ
jgi:hypothetical protein